MSERLVEIRDLSVEFSGVPAVKRVSLHIERGETLALVGESGSGKSATALSILQLLPGSARHPSGSIRVDGIETIAADEATLRQIRGAKVSMIFQEPMTSLNPLHTIEKQVAEILWVHQGLKRRELRGRVIELLELVGLRDAETRLQAYPHELSGGERQRVMIAMAVANEPDLLIADEPTTALDVTIQAQILALLTDLQERLGMALLLITHDLSIVRKLARRVCIMRAGTIVEEGTSERIFANPREAYTRQLLESEPTPKAKAAASGDAPLIACREPVPLYREGRQVGRVTTRCWSTLLKKYVGIATVEARCADPGTAVEMEVTVNFRRERVAGRIAELAHFRPDRLRA